MTRIINFAPRPMSIAARAKARQRTLPLPKLRQADVEPRLIDLVDLGAGDCRYPYGVADSYKFCGLAIEKSSLAYCPKHHELCHVPPDQARDRRFSRLIKFMTGATMLSSLAA
jgi:hypothetical protein